MAVSQHCEQAEGNPGIRAGVAAGILFGLCALELPGGTGPKSIEWIAGVDGEYLLEDGSRPADLWGANYHPGRGRDGCIEFTSLINIRPASGNRGMEVQDPVLRDKIQPITYALIGEGELL